MTDLPIDNPQASSRSRETPVTLRQQRNTALALVMAFVIVLLLVQLWLLLGAVEGALGGEGAIIFPATFASGLCFVGAWRLWFMLQQRF
jgi:Family of unknown function (DUF6755)